MRGVILGGGRHELRVGVDVKRIVEAPSGGALDDRSG
jgi:hypothetical protein